MTSTTRSNAWAPVHIGSMPFLVAMMAALIVTLLPAPRAEQAPQDFHAERAAMLTQELDRVETEHGACIAPSAIPAGSIPAAVAVSVKTGPNLVAASVEVLPFTQATWDQAKAGHLYVRCVIL